MLLGHDLLDMIGTLDGPDTEAPTDPAPDDPGNEPQPVG